MGGPQGRYGSCGNKKILLPLRRIEPRFLGRPVRSLDSILNLPYYTEHQCSTDHSLYEYFGMSSQIPQSVRVFWDVKPNSTACTSILECWAKFHGLYGYFGMSSQIQQPVRLFWDVEPNSTACTSTLGRRVKFQVLQFFLLPHGVGGDLIP